MLPIHLALVSRTNAIDIAEMLSVSAAIQKQIIRDFGPLWSVDATIDAFAKMEDVPLDYWQILIVDTFDHGGQHRERNNQPYALVAAGSSWSLAASHEALEMLADPSGNRIVAGPSPVEAQGRVEFLVEVCDPCQDDQFAYTVNDILVSDFYTPNYFDPVAAAGVRYSFSGAITTPREVLSGGYLTWREPTSGHWFQQTVAGKKSTVKDLGAIEPDAFGYRTAIDARTDSRKRLANLQPSRPSLRNARMKRQRSGKAMAARAAQLRDELKGRS